MEYIWKSEDYTEGDFNSDSSFLMGYFKAEEGALIYDDYNAWGTACALRAFLFFYEATGRTDVLDAAHGRPPRRVVGVRRLAAT